MHTSGMVISILVRKSRFGANIKYLIWAFNIIVCVGGTCFELVVLWHLQLKIKTDLKIYRIIFLLSPDF